MIDWLLCVDVAEYIAWLPVDIPLEYPSVTDDITKGQLTLSDVNSK